MQSSHQKPGAIGIAADTWFPLRSGRPGSGWRAERALVAVGDNHAGPKGLVDLSRSCGEGLLARMTTI